ncbi:hypothetical protein FQZ97_912820 [compost metagenome]
MRELRALLTDLQHLVNLLLVFHHAEAHLGVVDREDTLAAHRVLVKRDRNGAERLRGQHGGVEPGAVGTDHDHVFAALQAGLMQPAGQGLDQPGHVAPAGGLPDAVFLLAHRRRVGAALGVVQQQLGERRLHMCLLGRSGPPAFECLSRDTH